MHRFFFPKLFKAERRSTPLKWKEILEIYFKNIVFKCQTLEILTSNLRKVKLLDSVTQVVQTK